MPTCPKCHAEMRKGLAIEQTYAGGLPDFSGDDHAITMHAGGPVLPVECLKCPTCGFSRSVGARQQQEVGNG